VSAYNQFLQGECLEN